MKHLFLSSPKLKKLSLLLICKMLLVTGSISCSSAPKKKVPIASLCILDFQEQMCWIDKGHGVGISFVDMNTCDMNNKCWFALSEHDLERIYKGLGPK